MTAYLEVQKHPNTKIEMFTFIFIQIFLTFSSHYLCVLLFHYSIAKWYSNKVSVPFLLTNRMA